MTFTKWFWLQILLLTISISVYGSNSGEIGDTTNRQDTLIFRTGATVEITGKNITIGFLNGSLKFQYDQLLDLSQNVALEYVDCSDNIYDQLKNRNIMDFSELDNEFLELNKNNWNGAASRNKKTKDCSTEFGIWKMQRI